MIELTEVSHEAREIYRHMVEGMDENGYVGFEACLEISVLGIKQEGGLRSLGRQLMELTNAALVFNAPDLGGWYVRFPVKLDLLP